MQIDKYNISLRSRREGAVAVVATIIVPELEYFHQLFLRLPLNYGWYTRETYVISQMRAFVREPRCNVHIPLIDVTLLTPSRLPSYLLF